MSKEDQITRLYHRVHRTISAITPPIRSVLYIYSSEYLWKFIQLYNCIASVKSPKI